MLEFDAAALNVKIHGVDRALVFSKIDLKEGPLNGYYKWPILEAAAIHNPAMLKLLEQHGLDLSCRDQKDGDTVWHCLARTDSIETVRILHYLNTYPATKALLNAKNKKGATPLDVASQSHLPLTSKTLLDLGGVQSVEDTHERQALIFSELEESGVRESFKQLTTRTRRARNSAVSNGMRGSKLSLRAEVFWP